MSNYIDVNMTVKNFPVDRIKELTTYMYYELSGNLLYAFNEEDRISTSRTSASGESTPSTGDSAMMRWRSCPEGSRMRSSSSITAPDTWKT